MKKRRGIKIRKVIQKMVSYMEKIFLKNEREVHYINGADILPTPLSSEEEQDLIRLAASDEKKKSELIEHNLRLVVFIAKKFENTGAGIEELISIGTVGLMKAINTFCPDKNIKLATYASRCIENEILMFIRKNTAKRKEVSIDEPLSVDWDGNELLLSDILGSDSDIVCKNMEEYEERMIVRRAVDRLGEREKCIIELRFGLKGGAELTQKEVADMLGISQSYISRLEKKIMAKIKNEIKNYI